METRLILLYFHFVIGFTYLFHVFKESNVRNPIKITIPQQLQKATQFLPETQQKRIIEGRTHFF